MTIVDSLFGIPNLSGNPAVFKVTLHGLTQLVVTWSLVCGFVGNSTVNRDILSTGSSSVLGLEDVYSFALGGNW